MPRRAVRPCAVPLCSGTVRQGRYCTAHAHLTTVETRQRDARRPHSGQRGYTSKWRKASKAFLAKHPLCAQCAREGRVALATQTDHVIPHKGDKRLFWDRTNWQPLCDSCHSRKSATEHGGRAYSSKPALGDVSGVAGIAWTPPLPPALPAPDAAPNAAQPVRYLRLMPNGEGGGRG